MLTTKQHCLVHRLGGHSATRYKKLLLVTDLNITCDKSSESARERRTALYQSDQQQQHPDPLNNCKNVSDQLTGGTESLLSVSAQMRKQPPTVSSIRWKTRSLNNPSVRHRMYPLSAKARQSANSRRLALLAFLTLSWQPSASQTEPRRHGTAGRITAWIGSFLQGRHPAVVEGARSIMATSLRKPKCPRGQFLDHACSSRTPTILYTRHNSKIKAVCWRHPSASRKQSTPEKTSRRLN